MNELLGPLMAVILVLTVSVLLQLAAALVALRLIKTTGGKLAWLALSAAIMFMTVRRSMTLFTALVNYPDHLPVLKTELVALLISVLMLIAVIAIRPLFESIRRSEQALAEQTQRNKIILESSPDGFLITDVEGYILKANKAYCDLVGYTSTELLSMNLSQIKITSDNTPHYHLSQIITHGQGRFEVTHRHKKGHGIELELTAKYVDIGQQRFIYTFLRDITERKRADEALFEQKEKAQVTLAAIGDGVVTTDTSGHVQYLNAMAEQLCGMSVNKAINKHLSEVVNLIDEISRVPIADPIEHCIETQESLRLTEHTLLLSHGHDSQYSVEVIISPIKDRNNHIIGIVLILHDVTELHGLARQLSYQASHDPLTGLINRREFEARIEEALHRTKRAGQEHAMCYLDLDQFKLINDTCGHIAGDQLLRQVARILESCLRDSDCLARLGGDEFGVLLESCPLKQAQQVADKLRLSISEFRFSWEDKIFDVGVSIGLVPITAENSTLTDVMSAADSACYMAKDTGRNCVYTFTQDDSALVQHHGQMKWVQRLQRALDNNSFVLYCQTIRPLNSYVDDKDHVELLIRLRDEDDRLVMPDEFLPAAERYHLMPQIDRWVICQAFTYLNMYREPRLQQVSIFAINLSGQSLGDETFLEFVLQQFHESGLPYELICFEITETAVIGNIAYAREFIQELRKRGCQFSLDDFGSGLSSFSYLKSLPVDYLKIDGNFVKGILNDEDDYNMVMSINQIGHVMGIHTIAEFVESERIMLAVKKIGVDFVQGYHIGKPIALDDF